MSAGHQMRPGLDDDGVDMKKILAVGVVSLVIFAISAFVAYLIMRSDAREVAARGLPPVPSELGRDEIGIVDQVEFSQDHRLQEWKAAKRKRLETYGWVNRDKGLVHIPIETAIDQVVGQAGGGTP
jgi:hypothetical protein